MSTNCRFCGRIFSNTSAYSQHVEYCMDQIDSKESSLTSNINDMSLGSEGLPPNIEEVRN